VKKRDFMRRFSGVARDVIEALLDKYANDGISEIEKTEVLRLDPFRKLGNPARIAKLFGGREGYKQTIKALEDEIYREA
jgi:type I restriction enzyme R subunit